MIRKPRNAYGCSIGIDDEGDCCVWFDYTHQWLHTDETSKNYYQSIDRLRKKAAWLLSVADWWEAKNK